MYRYTCRGVLVYDVKSYFYAYLEKPSVSISGNMHHSDTSNTVLIAKNGNNFVFPGHRKMINHGAEKRLSAE